MQFACLLVKTYGFWSCQLLELMRSNFYKEKKEDVLLNKSQMLLGFAKRINALPRFSGHTEGLEV
jgi:hypothetical protein